MRPLLSASPEGARHKSARLGALHRHQLLHLRGAQAGVARARRHRARRAAGQRADAAVRGAGDRHCGDGDVAHLQRQQADADAGGAALIGPLLS